MKEDRARQKDQEDQEDEEDKNPLLPPPPASESPGPEGPGEAAAAWPADRIEMPAEVAALIAWARPLAPVDPATMSDLGHLAETFCRQYPARWVRNAIELALVNAGNPARRVGYVHRTLQGWRDGDGGPLDRKRAGAIGGGAGRSRADRERHAREAARAAAEAIARREGRDVLRIPD